MPLCGFASVNGIECGAKIGKKISKITCERGLPSDQDVVVAVFCREWKDFGSGRAQTPLRPVAYDRGTYLARDSEANAGWGRVATRKRLQNKTTFCPLLPFTGCGEKIAAFTQAVNLAHPGLALMYAEVRERWGCQREK